ncbi:MAG: DUF2508 family protein [Eubacteriales bacterium]|nr:DUF2508 family protein [Eubacteriales bacterium]
MRKLWNHYEQLPEWEPEPQTPEIDPEPRMPEIGRPVKNPYKIAGRLLSTWQQIKGWLFVTEPEDAYEEESEHAPVMYHAAQERTTYEDDYTLEQRKRDVEHALTQWKNAKVFFENVTDPTLVDYAVFEMEAAKKRYIYLLQAVRQKEEENAGMPEGI